MFVFKIYIDILRIKATILYLFSICPTNKVDKVEFDIKFIVRHNLPQNIIKIKLKMDRIRKIKRQCTIRWNILTQLLFI